MNHINFIKPVPPNKKKETRIWCWLTFIGISSSIVVLVTATCIQWSMYRAIYDEKQKLHQQLSSFTTVMDKQHKQVEENEILHQHLDKLTKYSKSPKSPVEVLVALNKALGTTTPIQSITISKNNFELNTICSNAQQADTCIQKLSRDNNFQNVKLVSLQTNQKQLLASFRGKVTI